MLQLGETMKVIDGVTVFSDHADPNRFWYLPAPVVLADKPDGSKAFTFIKYTDKAKTGGARGGGFLMFETMLTLDKGTERSILSALRSEADDPRLEMVPFDEGSVECVALNLQGGGGTTAAAATPGGFNAVEEILGTAVPSLFGENRALFSLTLSQEGSTILEQALGKQAAPIGVIYKLKFTALRPSLHVRIKADLERVYDELSAGLSANVAWFGATRPPLRSIGGFLKLSGWFLAWNFVMQAMRASDVVVLGIAGSPELVTIYTLSRYVPEAIFSVVAIAISAVMPGLGGLMGAQETERAASVRSESMTVTWLLATSAGAVFLVWQESFLNLWVGDEYYPGAMTNLLIIIMILQFAFIRNDASIIDLTLELRNKVLLGILSAAVSIVVAVVLIRELDMGIEGLALGFIAGRAIVGIAYPWNVCRSLGLSPLAQLRGALRPLLLSALLFAAAVAVSPLVTVGSWLALIPGAALSLAGFATAAFRLGLGSQQRARLSKRARQVLQRP